MTRVEDEVITHFYYTGSALLFTTVNEYVLQTQNILDPSGTIVASKRFEGQAETGQDPYADDYFFYRYDVRGSITNIVDGEGAVVKSYDYDEFGVTTSTGDTFFNEVTFTGSVADSSGLLYMNARYYNPATARFLSQDTYTGSASVPWTRHLYAYCNNNPVNLIDPTGHAPRVLTPPIRRPTVSVFDNKQSKKIVETAAVKKLPSTDGEQEEKANPNDYNIAMFNFGKADPILLEDGQMYYVEGSVSGFGGSLGMVILFDREKYCIYRYQGIGFGKGLTVDAVQSKGIVSNVYEVADYCGHFINGSCTLMGLGKAQSIGWKEDGSPVVANTIANSGWGSFGISYQYYGAFSEDWIYREAPIDWMIKQGQTLWNNAGPRIGTDDWRTNLYFGD